MDGFCYRRDTHHQKKGAETLTGMNFAAVVPTKGSSGRFGVDKALEFNTEYGDSGEKIFVKSDQGPSIEYFFKDLAEGCEEGRALFEESPVGSSGSNGLSEVCRELRATIGCCFWLGASAGEGT